METVTKEEFEKFKKIAEIAEKQHWNVRKIEVDTKLTRNIVFLVRDNFKELEKAFNSGLSEVKIDLGIPFKWVKVEEAVAVNEIDKLESGVKKFEKEAVEKGGEELDAEVKHKGRPKQKKEEVA